MKSVIKNHDYTYAWVPNSLILNVEKTKNVYSLRILRSLFTVPLKSIPDNGTVEVDTSLITNKKLKGSICITIKKACEDVMKTQIEVKTQNKNKFKIVNLFSSVERVGSVIKFKINKEAVETLIEEQSKGFTKIPCEAMLIFESKYEHKWVELLFRAGNYKKKLCYEIPTLNDILGANIKKMSHFKQVAIVEPFDGINKKLKASISYKFLKNSRNIVAVEIFDKYGKTIIPKIITTKKNTAASSVVSGKKRNPEDDIFEFACNCYDILPESEKKKYINEKLPLNDFFKRYEAIEKFIKKHKSILDKSNTAEEVLCAMGIDHATETISSSSISLS